MLRPNGKCLIIVPDGILEAPTLINLRIWLIKNCKIEKVIGLPRYQFAPYTHEKTYVLFLRKRSKPIKLESIKTERVWMCIVDKDGYANSDKRFRTGKKDENAKFLHDELSLWRDKSGAYHSSVLEENWNKKIQPTNEKYFDFDDKEIRGLKYGYVGMDQINEANFYNLLCEFYLRPLKIERIEKEEYIKELKSIKKTIEDIIKDMDTI